MCTHVCICVYLIQRGCLLAEKLAQLAIFIFASADVAKFDVATHTPNKSQDDSSVHFLIEI